jgi:SAM-dependent methyltransferase
VSEELIEEIRALAPWHMDVEVAPGVRTGQVGAATTEKDGREVSLLDPAHIKPLLSLLYPQGLSGKRVLDVACNSGGYCFVACDLGADFAFGFDVREHWIRQAEFLRRCLRPGDDRVQFARCDLTEIDRHLESPRFDLCLFKGIFYHLPDPVTGLKKAADMTGEILILDTATSVGKPDGFLQINFESAEPVMSGVHELAWLPTGPRVLERILNWLGFVETRALFWNKPPGKLGRTRIVAARSKTLLEHLDAKWQAP